MERSLPVAPGAQRLPDRHADAPASRVNVNSYPGERNRLGTSIKEEHEAFRLMPRPFLGDLGGVILPYREISVPVLPALTGHSAVCYDADTRSSDTRRAAYEQQPACCP